MAEPKAATTVAELEKRVVALEEKVGTLGSLRTVVDTVRKESRRLFSALEDVLDHVYGVNVRPLARERSDDEFAAAVVPTSADEGTDQFEKDVKR